MGRVNTSRTGRVNTPGTGRVSTPGMGRVNTSRTGRVNTPAMGRVNTYGWPDMPGRVVMHVDMDAFFAAIEEKFLPVIADRPVIVGGTADSRGVVTTANYLARQYGVGSATPLRTAARLCPDATFITSSHGAYADYSHRLVEIFGHFTPRVQQTSVDEAFIDVTGMQRHFDSPVALAKALKQRVRDELGLTCSVGIAPNKLLAKMASSHYKPDGLFQVPPDRVLEWLAPQPVSRLWGIGHRTEQSLHKMSVRTIGDLQAHSIRALERRFGKWGRVMYDLARGTDRSPVRPEGEQPREKSVGNEHTFATDTDDPVLWHATLLALSDRVGRRLRQAELRGRTITLKYRTDDFKTRTHAVTLPAPTSSEQAIFGAACRLLVELHPAGRRVRLLGVSISRLTAQDEGHQAGLFGNNRLERSHSASRAVDRIRDRFGGDAIRRLGAHF